jgi:hypothetical protein
MSTAPVKVFNAFDLQFECSHGDQLHLQETIQYCELRFHAILLAFGQAGQARQQVIQRALHQELVCYPLTRLSED